MVLYDLMMLESQTSAILIVTGALTLLALAAVVAPQSLVTLRRVALQPIDEPSFGGA
jgi:hypothetical protein